MLVSHLEYTPHQVSWLNSLYWYSHPLAERVVADSPCSLTALLLSAALEPLSSPVVYKSVLRLLQPSFLHHTSQDTCSPTSSPDRSLVRPYQPKPTVLSTICTSTTALHDNPTSSRPHLQCASTSSSPTLQRFGKLALVSQLRELVLAFRRTVVGFVLPFSTHY